MAAVAGGFRRRQPVGDRISDGLCLGYVPKGLAHVRRESGHPRAAGRGESRARARPSSSACAGLECRAYCRSVDVAGRASTRKKASIAPVSTCCAEPCSAGGNLAVAAAETSSTRDAISERSWNQGMAGQ